MADVYEHPCRKAAREIWARFVGIPITEPYDAEFEWLEDRLLQLKDECNPNQIKRSLGDVCRELREGSGPPTIPIKFGE
jgi:hypothetical protein